MKYNMKQIFYTIALVFSTTIAYAQNDNNIRPVAQDLKVAKTEGNLLLTWSDAKATEEGSWQVEASADGEQFTMIGLVWGADPKASGTAYSFKQKNEKKRPGYRYYRVQFVSAQNEIAASKTIGLTK